MVGLRRLFAVVAVLALLAGLAVLSLLLWRPSVDRQLDASWRKQLGGPSFLERYPKTEENATVRDLVKLAAEMGIGLQRKGEAGEAPGQGVPTPEAAARYKAADELLRAAVNPSRQAEDGSFPPLEPAVVTYLEFARPTLVRVEERLRRGPMPVWKRDLSAGFETTIPDFLWTLALQRLLLVEARERLRSGETAKATEAMEASWRLFAAVRESAPHLISQLVAQVFLKLQQPVLRAFAVPPPAWRNRLESLDQRARMQVGLQLECFEARVASRSEHPLGNQAPAAFPEAIVRWMLWDYSRRCASIFRDLEARDVRTLDADAFLGQQLATIPRWQVVARLLLPNFSDVYLKAARRELEAELTLLVWEERERLVAGTPAPATGRKRPSRVRGLSWLYEETPETVTIRLDGDLREKESKPVPLRFVLRKAQAPLPDQH